PGCQALPQRPLAAPPRTWEDQLYRSSYLLLSRSTARVMAWPHTNKRTALDKWGGALIRRRQLSTAAGYHCCTIACGPVLLRRDEGPCMRGAAVAARPAASGNGP